MFNLKLKKHHIAVLTLVALGIIAWAIWTFILLPTSEAPSLPDPTTESPAPPMK